jgi:hypothetical protein
MLLDNPMSLPAIRWAVSLIPPAPQVEITLVREFWVP